MMYFEDLEVGASQTFGNYQVTREEVIEFATKYDPQGFHLSDEEASGTHFGRLAASGWHTCAMTMRMLVDNIEANGGQKGLGCPGVVELPTSLQILAHPAVMGIAVTLFLIEFIADKIPLVDSAWDAVHTFIRPPPAMVLAYASFGGDVPEIWKIGAGLR